jgi:hypothetical protein
LGQKNDQYKAGDGPFHIASSKDDGWGNKFKKPVLIGKVRFKRDSG